MAFPASILSWGGGTGPRSWGTGIAGTGFLPSNRSINPMERRTSMPSDLNAPGLKTRRNRDGTRRLYWCARADIVKAGYRPETVRLPYSLEDPSHSPLIEAACRKYQAEMLEWSSGRNRDPNRYDGTIRGLSRRYQTDEASPFNKRMKHTTRAKDLHVLKLIEKAFGDRSLAAIHHADFWRWYEAAKRPKVPGGPERVRRAWGVTKKL